MPRTKRPLARQEKGTDNEELKKLDKLAAKLKRDVDSRTQGELSNVDLAFKILLSTFNKKHLQMTVGQLKSEHRNTPEEPPKMILRRSSSSVLIDDGYNTANSSQGSGDRKAAVGSRACPTSCMKPVRRSRSASASSRKVPLTASKQQQRRRSRSVNQTPSVYKTPMYKNALLNYPAITPKVAPHTSLMVLRQPRQGEMVVSMTGSPVMVPTYHTMQADEKANCNILLQDGTMLSLQPKQLRKSQAYIPFSLMDSGTLDQLKTLKENLGKLVEIGEKELM